MGGKKKRKQKGKKERKKRKKRKKITEKKKELPDRESNPGLPRDRRRYSPLYYRGPVVAQSPSTDKKQKDNRENN